MDWPVNQAGIPILISKGETDRVEQTADSSRLRDFPVDRGAIARYRGKKTDGAQIDLLLPLTKEGKSELLTTEKERKSHWPTKEMEGTRDKRKRRGWLTDNRQDLVRPTGEKAR